MSSHTEVEGGAAEGSRLDASAHTFPVGSKCCACSSPGIGLLHIQATVWPCCVEKPAAKDKDRDSAVARSQNT